MLLWQAKAARHQERMNPSSQASHSYALHTERKSLWYKLSQMVKAVRLRSDISSYCGIGMQAGLPNVRIDRPDNRYWHEIFWHWTPPEPTGLLPSRTIRFRRFPTEGVLLWWDENCWPAGHANLVAVWIMERNLIQLLSQIEASTNSQLGIRDCKYGHPQHDIMLRVDKED